MNAGCVCVCVCVVLYKCLHCLILTEYGSKVGEHPSLTETE